MTKSKPYKIIDGVLHVITKRIYPEGRGNMTNKTLTLFKRYFNGDTSNNVVTFVRKYWKKYASWSKVQAIGFPKMYKQLILIEFRNTAPFIYEIRSRKPITIDRVAKHFEVTEGWNEERDNIMFVDEPTTLDL